MRMHPSFAKCGESPFAPGFAVVDPDTPARVAKDAQRIKQRGQVMLCTLVDAWAPEAQEYELGRQCLGAILAEPGWSVRVLTKRDCVVGDYDLIQQYADRVLVGLSITATREKEDIMRIIEPRASSIGERMDALEEAARGGLRTYGMFCPLLPGIADAPEQIDQMVAFAVACNVEEIFVEPVNPRGPGLRRCQEALTQGGLAAEAEAVGKIRSNRQWSSYALNLVRNVQRSVRRHSDISKLRILLYPSRMLPEHVTEIRQDDAGVVWL